MDLTAMQDQAEARARDYFASLPDDMTVRRAMALGWGGERNLALRKALGIRFPGKTVVQVNQGDVIQVATPDRRKADYFAAQLRAELVGWTVSVTRRPDRQWLVTGYPSLVA